LDTLLAPCCLVRDAFYDTLVTKEEWTSVNASDVEGIPDDAQRVPFEVIQAQVEGINEAIQAGHMDIHKENDGPDLRRTDKSALDELEVDQ
jgi:hypothetical protein